MKIYIAAPYPAREMAVAVMHALENTGHEITSRWLKAPDELSDKFAKENLADVESADVLLALNPDAWGNIGTGGRHIELGYALARQKRIVLTGVRSNIFHYLSEVYFIPWTSMDTSSNWAAFVAVFNDEVRMP